MNPAKELKNLLDSCQDTLDWGGSMHKYLKDMIDSIGNLKLVSKQENQRRIFKKQIYREFRYALRCARRVNRYYGKVKGALEKLKPIVGETVRKRIEEIEGRLRSQEAAVIAESSYFRGRLRDDLNVLEARINTDKLTSRDVDTVVRAVKELLAEDRRSVGLIPFMIGVENVQMLMKGLQRKVA